VRVDEPKEGRASNFFYRVYSFRGTDLRRENASAFKEAVIFLRIWFFQGSASDALTSPDVH
jgi:hypothetical protein